MQRVLEEEATLMKSGGSIYALLPPAYFKFLDIEVNEEKIIHDVKIAMALGKYGKFLYLYSSKQQKKWQKEQEAEKKEKVEKNGESN